MTTDIKKKTQTGHNMIYLKYLMEDIVKVGQRTLLYRDLFSVSLLDVSVITNVAIGPYARSDRKDHRPTELYLATIDEIKGTST